MSFEKDLYPTRTEAYIEPFERLDPVIFSERGPRASGPLNSDQLSRYEQDGFLVLDSFIKPDQLQGFMEDLKDYSRDVEFKKKPEVITEPHADEIRSIFGIHALSDRFDQLTRDPRLLDTAQQLLGSDVYIHQSRINDKPGFSGTGFNWHSDFETWHSEDGMPRMRCFSMSILLTENNEFNGPLMLIPGSHKWFIPTVGKTPDENWKQSLKSQTIGVPQVSDLHRMARSKGIVAPKGPAGSIVLFECNTLHASANNLSPWPRRNLFFVYNSVENKLQMPYCGNSPRPEYIASRDQTPVLKPQNKAA